MTGRCCNPPPLLTEAAELPPPSPMKDPPPPSPMKEPYPSRSSRGEALVSSSEAETEDDADYWEML